jgi:hypothetical protein
MWEARFCPPMPAIRIWCAPNRTCEGVRGARTHRPASWAAVESALFIVDTKKYIETNTKQTQKSTTNIRRKSGAALRNLGLPWLPVRPVSCDLVAPSRHPVPRTKQLYSIAWCHLVMSRVVRILGLSDGSAVGLFWLFCWPVPANPTFVPSYC